MDPFTANNLGNFATAHSRGLIAIRQSMVFATAHSRGLRQYYRQYVQMLLPLPQRIRAGCDLRQAQCVTFSRLCHSTFVRVATFTVRYKSLLTGFATAHSCGLRRGCTFTENVRTNLCHSAFVRVATAEKQCSALRICCEKVDSFSSVGESGLALTIFPFSFAAKATYVAINDSFGRAIDRFFGANRTGISVSYDFAEHPCL